MICLAEHKGVMCLELAQPVHGVAFDGVVAITGGPSARYLFPDTPTARKLQL